MSTSYTTLESTDLDHVTGGLDLGPAKRAFARGVQYGAYGMGLGATTGLIVGSVVGGYVSPEASYTGASLGTGAGAIVGGVAGFGTGVVRELSGR